MQLDEDGEEEEGDKLGGLFKLKGEKQEKSLLNGLDCSCFTVQGVKEWELDEVCSL